MTSHIRKTQPYPLQLRLLDVVQLVADNAELHHRVAAEDGPAERQARIVGAAALPPVLALRDQLRALAGAAQLRPFRLLRIVLAAAAVVHQ